jgi:hypothetical protein
MVLRENRGPVFMPHETPADRAGAALGLRRSRFLHNVKKYLDFLNEL